MPVPLARLRPLLLLVLLLPGLAGCGGGRTAWNGRRGYDGNGDYGYDPAGSRQEARSYRSSATGFYPPPGPREDPWGPYVQQAASRHQVPERWIRAVMRQESGGRLYASDGSLITSGAGAMGLMQVMPRTYDMLRGRYGLGSDPFDPRDNIMAGTAYMREMYDRYGAPGFLAAYNAGPDRLERYLAGSSPLPDETVNYLARIAPQLGTQVAMTGPLAVFAGSGAMAARAPVLPPLAPAYAGLPAQDPDAAYAGGGLVGGAMPGDTALASAAYDPDAVDPSDRAFDGGGLVTAGAPTGALTGRGAPIRVASAASVPIFAAPLPPPVAAGSSRLGQARPAAPILSGPLAVSPLASAAGPRAAAALTPVLAPGSAAEGWGIQVGAFADPAISRAAIANARAHAGPLLGGAAPAISTVQRDVVLYRARFTGLSGGGASQACAVLLRDGVACLTVPPGS